MSFIILYISCRSYGSPFFHQFLSESLQSTVPEFIERIEEMKEWCDQVIDQLCGLQQTGSDFAFNWNCHLWLMPVDNCFWFYHPVEDSVNGLAEVKFIGCDTKDSPYRIHRDALSKATSSILAPNDKSRFALTYPLFQIIILATDLPEEVAKFIQRQGIQCFGFNHLLNIECGFSRIPDEVLTVRDRAKLVFWLVLTNIYDEARKLQATLAH